MADSVQGSLRDRFNEDGFVTGLKVFDKDEVTRFRKESELAEQHLGHSLHYMLFPNLLFAAAEEMAMHPRVLDTVEELLGPDFLCYESSFIIKEPGSKKRVSWHQDLTYWGLDTDDLLTVWIALSPATAESGCMMMVPRSHKQGRLEHVDLREENNVLSRGQTIPDVNEDAAVLVPLAPGEMSVHHGWVMHASRPNVSDDRRIGFSMIFLRPDVKTSQSRRDVARLARGKDVYKNYDPLPAFTHDFDPDLIARREEIDRRRNETWQTT